MKKPYSPIVLSAATALLLGTCLCDGSEAGTEQLRVHLAGDELLVEAVAKIDTERPSSPPGIYVVDGEGHVALAIAGGGAPSWSPDRRRIAFWRTDRDRPDPRRCVFFADRTSREVHQVPFSDGMRWQRVPTPGESGTVARPLQWMPDGTAVLLLGPVFEDVSELAWFSLVPAGGPDGGSLPPVRLLPGAPGVCQGRVAIRPDGAVAFARLRSSPGLGYVSRDVVVLLPGASEPVRVVPRGLPEDAVIMNPHWRPGGSQLSVDVAQGQGQRQVCLLDPSDPASELQPMFPAAIQDWHTMVAWSPNGSTAILCIWYGNSGGPFALYWPDVRHSPEGARLLRLGGTVALQACFAPDGGRVACLDGDVLDDQGLPARTLLVVRDSLRREGPARVVVLPKGLTAVSIAW
jgi:hypothetical protein